ncbi:MAG: 2,3-bisphosphoglycerate-independent phosphoglycerate mutase [Patescibacteria group bacterium]
MKNKNVTLIVLDGWGYREESKDNAIKAAKTPVFNALWEKYPHTLLDASGLAVGLPQGQMGNSEIGHTTIGAGKVIDTDLVRIAKAITNGEFETNPAFRDLFEHVKKHDSTLHVKGLLGTGGVHAHSDHLVAFVRAAKNAGVTKIAIHVFTDGRDAPPQSAGDFLTDLEKSLEDIGIGFIASATGRFYAMDRDNNWDRIQKAEDALFHGKGKTIQGTKPSAVVRELYKEGKLDEHLEPMVFLDESGKAWKVEKNDGVFFFNFRADRARQISKKIVEKKETHNILFVTLTEYEKTLAAKVAYPQATIETTLAAEISKVGMTQAHLAETEKFPHATYFLNGGKENPHEGESHILLDSRKDVPTHDLAPKMRAEAIADKAIEEIEKGTNFIFINFANPDMVGHTANVPAIIEAVEEVDMQLGRVIAAIEKNGGVAFVTADHGNAEVNIDPITGTKHTSHTINPVPAILTSADGEMRTGGGLADITPTILEVLDIKQPESMTGTSLLKK